MGQKYRPPGGPPKHRKPWKKREDDASKAEKPQQRAAGAARPAAAKAPGGQRLGTRTRQQEAGIRINRYIAQAGVAARRKADEMIAEGLVRVNGEVVTKPGQVINPGDVVEVNGRVISPREYVYVLMNKPDDTITTVADERGRRTVLDLISLEEKEKAGLFPIGRLDRHTVGVLLLTNDGELAHRLMHPRYDIVKIYRVRTADPVKPHQLDQLRIGVELEDGLATADRVEYLDPKNLRELGIQLHEGRNRQVRRMLEALGHQVDYLERISYAGLTTRGIRRGHWRKLYPHEVDRLRNLVKLK